MIFITCTASVKHIAHLKLLLLLLFAAFALLVKPALSAITERRDIAYGPDATQRLDLCLPRMGAAASPAVLLIHGGGWNHGSKSDFLGLCHYFAERGILAATIDYRYADGSEAGRWPAQLVDAQLAVRWLRANSELLRLDPDRICAYGNSAGGQIATWLAVTRATQHGDDSEVLSEVSSSVACAVDNFGPVDFTVPAPFLPALERFFPGADAATRKLRAAEVSPFSLVGSDTSPLFIAHGFRDVEVPVGQSIALAQVAARAGVHVDFVGFDGGHEWKDLSEASKNAIRDMEFDFILTATKPPSIP